MPSFPIPVAAAMLLALAAAPGAASAQREGWIVGQFAVQQQVVVRLSRVAPTRPVEWKEKKGPKCIALDSLAGALVSQPNSIDLVQTGGARVRAALDKKCLPLDYYSGLYIRPTADGRICADRDAVRSRSGRACEIEKFRVLVARK